MIVPQLPEELIDESNGGQMTVTTAAPPPVKLGLPEMRQRRRAVKTKQPAKPKKSEPKKEPATTQVKQQNQQPAGSGKAKKSMFGTYGVIAALFVIGMLFNFFMNR